MPALSHQIQMHKRASLARVLAQMTFGLGLSTFAAMSEGTANAQSCDRCGALTAPSCGCEHAKGTSNKAKPCSCQCVPKPSLGEKLLSQFDLLGDRIEAKAKSSQATKKCKCDQLSNPLSLRTPTCGCESSGPNCGCEFNSVANVGMESPMSFSYQQPPLPYPSSYGPSASTRGLLSDKVESSMPTPRTTSPQIVAPQKTDITVGPTKTNQNIPSMPPSAPQVQRVPFEQRKPDADHGRIPAETLSPRQSAPSTLKPTPVDPPPPAMNPRQITPNTKPVPPANETLPDVLVDPFKDDASFRSTRQKADGVLLTSGRSKSGNSLYLVPSRKQPTEVDASNSELEMPASLTPAQRQAPSPSNPSALQFEADMTSGELSRVIPSSYMELVPVKISRKAMTPAEASDVPQVSKIRVPQRR